LKNLRDCEELCKSAQGAILFHIAGVIHPQRIAEFYEVNVRGSINLLQAAAKFGVQRVIVISSNSPFGCNPHPDHLFDETSSYHPYLNYGRSQMEMEKLVSAMQASGAVETVIVRPPWFYGPNQPLRQTLFFTMIRDGKVPIVGSGESLRSMAYVDNIVQGMLLAAIVPNANGQAYWIADERPYSMREIVDTIEDVLEREFGKVCRRKRLRLPNIISSIAYAMDSTIQAVGFYNQKLHVLSEMNKTIACSIAKARRDLGFDPKIELREGMRRSIASVQASI
jgi:nucleoside-diphosphate-sugar epimerase